MLVRSISVLVMVVAGLSIPALAEPPDFAREVRPILEKSCYVCHGPEKQTSGYRLDVREVALKGGESGEEAIVPHKAAESLLIQYVSNPDPDLRMPPADSEAPPLTPEQIQTLRAWIDAGPTWPNELAGTTDDGRKNHWAWRPVHRPEIPDGESANLIDRFLLAKLREQGNTFAPPADARTLIRRLTYDLTGLPPTYQDVVAFEQNPSPAAYEALVTRLLDSPRYGERWGRKWLDVVRYADTAGDTADFPVMDAWRYRNWVIDAFNNDLPYDEFLREQLAGDILAQGVPDARTADLVTATGYWALARRFGADGDKDMYLTYDDAIDNLGKAVLGLSISCARCHDHKYDPITTRDYYGIYGMLASTKFAFPGTELKPTPRDMVPIMSATEQELMTSWTTELSRLEAALAKWDVDYLTHARQADSLAPVLATLASGEFSAIGANDFSREAAAAVILRAGEMLQLSILMRGNHGGDATSVELAIEELGGAGRHWNAVKDLVPDLHQSGKGAEHADSQGNANVWLMYDLEPGAALLDSYEPALFGTQGVPAWRRGDFPLVMVNTRETAVKLQTITAPPKSLALHPGARAGVALAWRAPADGVYRVQGRVQKIDPGGDGIAWRLEKRADLHDHFAAAAKILEGRKKALAARDAHLATRLPQKFAYAVSEAESAGNAKILLGGDPDKLGAEVPRKNLDLFGGETVETGSGRKELATWLCRAEHPLTARVMVNRIWQGHFGRGIVGTSNDFGTRGQPPTDPELLDWLASEFVARGWSIKAMHRLMVATAAYQQRCDASESVWPVTRRRLDAEEIRDSLLAASGGLDLTPGTTHPFKVTSGYKYSQHVPFSEFFDSKKRSVYLITLRLKRHPMLGLFDGADPNATTPGRAVSTVSTQALYFLNDPFFHSCAEAFARQVAAAADRDTQRLDLACQVAFQRSATAAEQERSGKFLADAQQQLTDVPEADRKLAAWVALSRVLLGSNEFLYLD